MAMGGQYVSMYFNKPCKQLVLALLGSVLSVVEKNMDCATQPGDTNHTICTTTNNYIICVCSKPYIHMHDIYVYTRQPTSLSPADIK